MRKTEEVVKALRTLGITGDKMYERVADAIEGRRYEEAREQFNWIDVLLKALDEDEKNERRTCCCTNRGPTKSCRKT